MDSLILTHPKISLHNINRINDAIQSIRDVFTLQLRFTITERRKWTGGLNNGLRWADYDIVLTLILTPLKDRSL
jgi:hypothetical protein